MQPKSTRGVQQVDVDFAADALLAEKQRPTIERVRLKLGRGSPNTVAPMLETWFARLGSRLGMHGAAGEGQLGESVPLALQTAAQTLWKSALSLAQEQAKQALHERDVALGVRQAELDGRAQALTQREVTLAGREEALHEGLNLAKRQLEEQDAKNAQLQFEIERANGQLTVVRAAAADQAQAASAERQRMEVRLSEVIATQQQAEERAGTTERRFLAEVDRGRQEIKRLQGELKAGQQQ